MTGYVYAISAGDAVKIGWSEDPLRRLNKISSDCPQAPQLVGFVEATKEQEAEAHALLARWRIRGEWFRQEGAVIAFAQMVKDATRTAIRDCGVETEAHPIKAFRAAGDLTLEAFATLVGVGKAAVFKWERGMGPSPETAINIEDRTGIPRSKLRPDLWPASSDQEVAQ